ncbi:2-dehydropantoate 2-reductase [Terrarubrum flagellatum]|uniref:ketopantoate reductase family protein n=1 Tax=Terrirubrum flagellatum TaxID=2895980 RepID=UPI003144FF47
MIKIAIVGPGAVASVLAWHLARAGLGPSLVARPATAAAIMREGLTVVGPNAGQSVPIAVTDDAASLGVQDIVFVGFKAHDWPDGLSAVTPLIGPDTLIVPMLNGVPWWFFQGFGGAWQGRDLASVDPDRKLRAAIPMSQVIGCVVYIAAERETSARVRWNGRKRLVLGEPLESPANSDRVNALVKLLKSADFDGEAATDIRHALWQKLLGNVTYNPLSVVANATMDRMAEHPPLARLLRLMMEEAVAVAKAVGIPGTFDLEERLKLSPLMKGVKTSMLQDFEAGRALELGAIVNAVVEVGKLVNAPTAMIETIGALAAERSHVATR